MPGSTFDPETLVIGVVGRPHGVRGEVKVRLYNARAGLPEGAAEVILERAGKREIRRMRSQRAAHRELIVWFEDVGSREAAAALTNAEVRVYRSALPALASGEFYIGDLVGYHVTDEVGEALGTVAGTFWNGAHDVMTVSGASEHLIPVVPAYVASVDAVGRRMIVRWRAGDLR